MVTKSDYDAAYYGMAGQKGNYSCYGPESVPDWSVPLATVLVLNFPGRYLDVGCAYGHLVRDINRACVRKGGIYRRECDVRQAVGIEWSDYAAAHKVACADDYIHADARVALNWLPGSSFGTVTSLDFLEHFEPTETRYLLYQMMRVLAPGGWMVHLVGAPDASPTYHTDPTHQNSQPLTWYLEQLAALGMRVDDTITQHLAACPPWCTTDWAGRFVVAQKPDSAVAGLDTVLA